MLVLHSRTIAFIAAFSTFVQSIIWIVGYVMYILMYSCVFKSDYFVSTSGKEDELPLTLGPYFMWYFQGSACVTSLTWINSVRGGNLRILVTIFSVGFGLNCILLTISLTLISGLYTNIMLYKRIVIYAIAVYIVSIWDAVMVGFVIADFRPLLNSKNFELSESGNPGDLAMPYFSNVFTILILLLSRFICIWLANVLLMTYLLLKNNTVKNDTKSSLPRKATFEKRMDHTPAHTKWNTPDTDEKFWGERPTSNGHLSKWPVTDVHQPDYNDEVAKRWKISKGISDEASYSSLNSSSYDESRTESKMKLSTLPKSDWELDGDRWKNVENHILESENKWKTQHQTPVTQEIENEPFRSPPRPKTPSVVTNTPESFKVQSSNETTAIETNPDSFPDTKQKSMEGFTYLGEPSTQTSDTSGIFGIKLRPVHRDSLKHEREISSSMVTTNESSSAVPYAISAVIGVGTHYDDQSVDIKWPSQASSSFSQQTSDIRVPSPPDAPPLNNLDMKQSGVPKQISLEEAIKTRRPLKPLNRPGIDTSC